MQLLRRTLLIAVTLALVAPAAATAASKPTVTTGGVANITPTSATLNGRVNPNGAETTYFFRFGTTRLYGTDTDSVSAGSGTTGVRVSIPIGLLAPATTYHYRLIARNRLGITFGVDRTFKTKVQPLGVTLAANPNPVAPGGSTTLAGQLTGTNNANRDVVLQSNPWPYTPPGFVNAGNPQVTDGAGNFSFAVLSVPVTTQFRVVLAQRPEVASPIVIVGAALQVTTRARKVARHRHSVSVRFRGSITPAHAGGRVAIQKFRGGQWVEIAHTFARDVDSSHSRYRTRVRLFRSGLFRVVAVADGQYASGAGRAIQIKVRR